MRTFIFAIIAVLLLSGCSNKKTPLWLSDSQSYLDKFKIAKLSGSEKEATIYKQKAISSVKQSANIEYLQIIELTEVAMDTALLKEANFATYDRLSKIEQNATNNEYKQMLCGTVQKTNTLPPMYEAFATSLSKKDINSAIENAKTIEDETSKLIALGVLAKLEPKNKQIYEEILSISKPNGYKNVTIAAISRLQAIYAKDGDKEKSQKLLLVLEELKR